MKYAAGWGAALLVAAGCASGPPKETLPERTAPPIEHRAKPDEIVAFYNGAPLTWQMVAEKMLELNLKESVDQYVRWRVVEDRKAALAIANTPVELRRRAEVYLGQARKQLGEDAYRLQLTREGVSEDRKLAQLEGSAFLSQLLTLDKMVRTAELTEDRFEIDRAYFVDEAEARRFREACGEKGFDAAAKELPPGRGGTKGLLAGEAFLRSKPPSDPVLDPEVVDKLARTAPGGLTGVEASRSGLTYVIRLRGFRKGRNVVYSEVKEEVLESILKEPPTPQDYQGWMERELGRTRVEYAEAAARRERRGGSP
jgi:hypothetical protein